MTTRTCPTLLPRCYRPWSRRMRCSVGSLDTSNAEATSTTPLGAGRADHRRSRLLRAIVDDHAGHHGNLMPFESGYPGGRPVEAMMRITVGGLVRAT
jgi:hypothetical protein